MEIEPIRKGVVARGPFLFFDEIQASIPEVLAQSLNPAIHSRLITLLKEYLYICRWDTTWIKDKFIEIQDHHV